MPPLGVDPTPWEILGVPEGSSAAIVRTAWRRAVRSYHPDHVGGGDIDKFHAVNGAYRELEAGFGQLRGTHPVEVGDLSDMPVVSEPAGAGADDDAIFGFLDGSSPAPASPTATDGPAPAEVTDPTAGPPIEDDPDAEFEATIDRLLGAPQRRSWRARRTPAPAPLVVRPDPRPEPPELSPGSEIPAPTAPVDDDLPGPPAPASDTPDRPVRRSFSDRASGFERPQFSSSTVAGAASAVGFVAWRSILQAVVPGVFGLPLGVLVLVGVVVGSLCWFVAQRLGAEEAPKPAFAAAAAAVAILGAMDILLLVAVPILLVVAVAYAVIHQRRAR